MTTRVSRLYVPRDLRAGQRLELTGQPSHYLRNVLRLREGDDVVLFNGTGGEFRARIVSVQREQLELNINVHDPVDRESPLATHLGLAVSKREAMDFAVRKATELGVTTITPILADFSSVPRKQADRRVGHWQEIAHSACEQSGRTRPPAVNEVTTVANWLAAANAGLKLIAAPGSERGLADIDPPPESIALITGPEGGFSDSELHQAGQSGFQTISLGKRILRADTAPVAVLSLIQYRWGDLGPAPRQT